jgi:hypothetical protein
MSDDLVVGWELEHLADRGFLEPREVICEVEEAWNVTGWGRGRLGAVVLTDLQILFTSTTTLRRRVRVDAYPLTDIGAVEVVDSMWDDRGAFRLQVDQQDDHQRSVSFERIPGGRTRAEALVRSIEHQRSLLDTR